MKRILNTTLFKLNGVLLSLWIGTMFISHIFINEKDHIPPPTSIASISVKYYDESISDINKLNEFKYQEEIVPSEEYTSTLADNTVQFSDIIATTSNIIGDISYKDIMINTWKGGQPIEQDRLSATIYIVLNKVDILPPSKDVHDLILETSAVESLRGQILKYASARGIYQLEISSVKYLLKWLQDKHDSVYANVMYFYNSNNPLEWNLKYNIPFQTAMCLIHYWNRSGDHLVAKITDRRSRATVWKKEYNTNKGKGTVAAYLKKSEQFIDVS